MRRQDADTVWHAAMRVDSRCACVVPCKQCTDAVSKSSISQEAVANDKHARWAIVRLHVRRLGRRIFDDCARTACRWLRRRMQENRNAERCRHIFRTDAERIAARARRVTYDEDVVSAEYALRICPRVRERRLEPRVVRLCDAVVLVKHQVAHAGGVDACPVELSDCC